MNPKDAPFQAFKNRKKLTNSCGCFGCMTVLDVKEIEEWTDNDETAICPHCNKDTVIPDTDNLQEIHEHWFKKEEPKETSSQDRLRNK